MGDKFFDESFLKEVKATFVWAVIMVTIGFFSTLGFLGFICWVIYRVLANYGIV